MIADFQQWLLGELGRLLEPITAAAESTTRRRELFEAIGWDLEVIPGLSVADVEAILTDATVAYEQVLAATERPPETLDELAAALDTAARAVAVVQRLGRLLDAPNQTRPPGFERLPGELLSYLTTEYLWNYRQVAFHLLSLLSLITPAPPGAPDPNDIVTEDSTGAVLRVPRPRPALRLERLGHLLSNPTGTLREEYLGNQGLTTEAGAQATADKLFPRLINFLSELGVAATYGVKPEYGVDFGEAGNEIARRSMALFVELDADVSGEASGLGAVLSLSSADRGDLGVVVRPFGTLSLARVIQSWLLGFQAALSAPAFAVGPHGLTLPAGFSGSVALRAIARKLAGESGAALTFGSTRGTRLEVGQLHLMAEASLNPDRVDFGLLTEAASGAIVIAAGDGDGFLQRVLPPEGIRTAFDLALGWSSRKGVFIRGSAGLEATLPIGQDLFGVLRVDTAYLALRPSGDAVRAIVAATVTVQLGPVAAAIEQFGLEATFTFPPNGGNLGAANLALAFKPPSGAGLSIDAGVVVGGGYLFFDLERQQYAGAVQLEIAKSLSLTAFGLITTRMPDGSPGFSLLVLIAARFTPPIQLGYGFTLNGIGGILGVNRTVDVETLRAGLRAGALGSILFPQDPIRNAPQIVSDLQAVFPPAPGRFLFGPMAILGWGTPTIVTLELGLLLELPAPVRLFILGRLRVLLPHEKAGVIRLQLDALGVIDFESGDVSLDAVLYDSQMAQFAVTGEMALRANFGNNPNFVLAVGGFNPRFQAPPTFPLLERVSISLATGNNPRLRLDAYFALTTNTVQFGARLELYARAGAFSIEGFASFDVLIQFDPFGFVADLAAAVALKYDGRSVLSIGLEATLTGPTPWHAVGRAHFKVLFFSGTIRFDVRFGQRQPPPLPPPVAVRPLLIEALNDPGNWSTQVPRNEHPLVSLSEQPASMETLVHPLADLRVSQRVVPLGREITRFGNTAPAGESRFTLGVVDPSGAVRSTPAEGVEPVTDFFAPAQFVEMSDDEKLSAPAFERMQAGIRFASQEYISGPAVVETEIRYERRTILAPAAAPVEAASIMATTTAPTPAAVESTMTIIPTPEVQVAAKPYIVPAGLVEQVASLGAAGQAPLAQTGTAKYTTPPTPIDGKLGIKPAHGVFLKPATFVAALGRGITALPLESGGIVSDVSADSGDQSYTAAMEALRKRLAAHPEERGLLKVVPITTEALA